MSDLHETLGVTLDASQKEIKLAYKRLAQQYHPDKNAGQYTDQFQAIKDAYEVLSDPQRRDDYDRTGSTQANNIDAEARSTVLELFKQAVGSDPDKSVDIIEKAKEAIANSQAKIIHELTTIEKKVEAINKMKGRVTHHNAASLDLWHCLIQSQLQDIGRKKHNTERTIKVMDRALEMLADYKCKTAAHTITIWGSVSGTGEWAY